MKLANYYIWQMLDNFDSSKNRKYLKQEKTLNTQVLNTMRQIHR